MTSMTEAADARKEIRPGLRAEFLPGPGTIAANEVRRGCALLTFQLQFEDLKRTSFAAADEKTIALHIQFGGSQSVITYGRLRYLQILSPELGIGAGPRLKSPHAIQDLIRWTGKVNEPILLSEDGCERGLRVILRARMNRIGLQTAQRCDHQVRSNGRKLRRKSF